MNKRFFRRAATAVLLAVGAASVMADDIDIFSASAASADAPNVLIVMDNSANWSQSFGSGSKFTSELTALATVVNALTAQFNLGIMMYTESGSGNTGNDGGYVRFAIQPMSTSNGSATDARNCLLKMVGSGSTCVIANSYYSLLDINGDKSNGGKGGLTMNEAYDYFAGVNAYAGNNKVKADPLAFLSGTIAGPTYKPPAANSCTKNYIIFINNGPFSDNASDTSTATTNLAAVGASGSTTQIAPPDGTAGRNNEADEWTRWLNRSPLAAVTYALEVGPATTGQGPYNTALLQSMGTQGKGGYYAASDAAGLLLALTRIFNDILATNSVFASSTLPLSADNSGAFANQLYMGVFRPDGGGKPRWMGNLKQYKFSADSNGVLSLVDSESPAQLASSASGFAQPDAVSFWTSKNTALAPDAPASPATDATNGSTGGFWYFDSKGSGLAFDSPDGEWVEKGGAAQQLRLAYLGYGGRGGVGATNTSTLNSKPARQLFTCTGTCPTATNKPNLSATPFDTSNTAITDTLLGVGSTSVSAITSATSKALSGIVAGSPITISQITNPSGKTIQVTTSTSHGYTTGDTVTISGTGTVYDASWASITVTGATTYTFTKSSGPTPNANPAAAGSASYKNVTTAVATSAAAHGYLPGQRVTVAGASPTGFNAVVTIVSVPDTTHFTYTLPAPVGGVTTTAGTVTSNTATVTSANHGLTTGDSITIAGATPTGYNVVAVVTVVDANTFTYAYNVAAPLANATGTITASLGGGRTTLISWVRGLDTQDENNFKVGSADTDVRASIHGDVLHSRPLVLNYGTPSTSDNVYIFYGGNDGVFRAVKGGQAATDGVEKWGFVAPEFFGKLKRLYNNSPGVAYPAATGVPTPTKRDYFFDGPVGSYVERNSTGVITKAYLYIGARRGGRFIYALDVTDINNPKFLWRIDNAGEFGELGQTWSTPTVAKIAANTNPVLIFGAGFDAASEDVEPPPVADTMGRAIYMVDAFTGAYVWAGGKTGSVTPPSGKVFTAHPGMNFSIPADLLVMDRNIDGYHDRIYATDVGGNVWRVDIGDASPDNWKIWKLAALGSRDGTSASTATTRKFLFGADAVAGATYDAVFVGTGDRDHPLQTNAAQNVVNRFYMLKDRNVGLVGSDLGISDACGVTFSTSCASANFVDVTSGAAVPATATGWALQFTRVVGGVVVPSGEKVVNAPVVVAGHILFGTNKPDLTNSTCSASLGIATRYDIFFDTTATGTTSLTVNSDIAPGGGFLPSTVAGVVEIDGKRYLFTTDNPLSPGGPTINPSVPTNRSRAYWRELLE